MIPTARRPGALPGSAVTDVTRAFKVACWVAVLSTALGAFFATQLYFAGLPWGQALAFTMPRWYAWGLLSPGVFWLDRRIGVARSLGARIAWHLPLGVAWTCVSIALRLVTRPVRGSALPDSIGQFFLERFYWDLLIYAAIAAVSISRDYAAQIRAREQDAHDRAIETTDLNGGWSKPSSKACVRRCSRTFCSTRSTPSARSLRTIRTPLAG